MQQTLRNLIANGKTKQAIAELRRLTASDSETNNAVNLLANRFTEYEKQKLGNLEDPSVLRIELNQINNALLVIIDRLKASDGVTASHAVTNSPILRGHVLSKGEPKKPLSGANIQVVGAFDKTFTDANGYFELACSDKEVGDEVSLTVFLKGYAIVDDTTLRGITLSKNSRKHIELVLQETAEQESKITKLEGQVIQRELTVKQMLLKEKLEKKYREKDESVPTFKWYVVLLPILFVLLLIALIIRYNNSSPTEALEVANIKTKDSVNTLPKPKLNRPIEKPKMVKESKKGFESNPKDSITIKKAEDNKLVLPQREMSMINLDPNAYYIILMSSTLEDCERRIKQVGKYYLGVCPNRNIYYVLVSTKSFINYDAAKESLSKLGMSEESFYRPCH